MAKSKKTYNGLRKPKEAYAQYSPKDRFQWRKEIAKKGSTYVGANGEIKETSPFFRGRMFERNRVIMDKIKREEWRKSNPKEFEKWKQEKIKNGEWRGQ